MANMIRYQCDGRNAAWPIPFGYADAGQVCVRAQAPDGTERALQAGQDYLVSGNVCYCVQPPGMRLIIYLNAPEATAAQLLAAQAARADGMAGPAAIPQAYNPDTDTDLSARIDAKLSTALSQIEEWSRLGLERLRAEQATALAANMKAIQEALSEALNRLNAAGLRLDEKGQTLAGEAKNFSEAAARAANAAMAASNGVAAARDAQGNAAITAQGWANASEKSADESHKAATSAWEAATQASIHAMRPGISAVHSIDDIHACSPGLFIINEHLSHAPTPFLGIWPAREIEDMAWDAVFFTSPYPYPDDPRLPPPKPERPAPRPVAASGSNVEWIPCGHTHEEEILYSSCPVCGMDAHSCGGGQK